MKRKDIKEKSVGLKRKEGRKILMLLELQRQMISNPWKKMLIKKTLKFLNEELDLAEQKNAKFDVENVISLLRKKVILSQIEDEISNWEVRWLNTLIVFLRTI